MDLLYLLNYLSQFDFKIKYNPGKNNVEGDSLSRNPVLELNENQMDQSAMKVSNLLSLEKIRENQKRLPPDEKQIWEENIAYRVLNTIRKISLTEDFVIFLIRTVHIEWGHIGSKQLTLMNGRKVHFKNMYFHIRMVCH